MEVSHSKIQNPLWDAIEEMRVKGTVYKRNGWLRVDAGDRGQLAYLQAMYGEVVSDPLLVDWVLKATGERVVEVDSATGYWSWMLGGAGKRMRTYVQKLVRPRPPLLQSSPQLTELTDLDRWTLLLVAPTDMGRVNRILDAYEGNTFVLIARHFGDANLDRRLHAEDSRDDEASTDGPGVVYRAASWLANREWPSKAERERVQDKARLDERLRRDWTLVDAVRGECFFGSLYEARLYHRASLSTWADGNTMLIPIVRTEARDDAT